ncbi:MAG: DUF2158 domain-containing protein [Bacteroidota bacterium]
MEKEFEIGDTVRLLSGGPLMTINESNKGKAFVDCIWFNVEGNKCESTFKMAIIMHDDDFDLNEFEMEEDEWDDDNEEEK